MDENGKSPDIFRGTLKTLKYRLSQVFAHQIILCDQLRNISNQYFT